MRSPGCRAGQSVRELSEKRGLKASSFRIQLSRWLPSRGGDGFGLDVNDREEKRSDLGQDLLMQSEGKIGIGWEEHWMETCGWGEFHPDAC